ncbi:MAG: InlB B-repeat-containing protein, partial [Candidatus Spyradocola sp.]
EDQIFAAKQTKALSANAFTKADHAFCGWNTAPDGSGDAYTDKQQITVTSDMTLYAQWTQNQYTVTFKSNGGEGTMEDQVFIAGQPQALAANAFTRKNHVFCGWNTAADGSGETLENRQLLTATSDMTLYAQWESANISALPQTGDNSRIAVWIALLAAACAALAIILRRNKKA